MPLSSTISPALKERVSHFEMNTHAYQEAQQKFASITEEDRRLDSQASSLERQAAATRKSLQVSAAATPTDQAAINAEIEREEQLKSQAQALRKTIAARSGLAELHQPGMSELRAVLRKETDAINQDHWRELLDQVLGLEGFRESVLQTYVLSRALYLSRLGSLEPVLARCINQLERDAYIAQGIKNAFVDELLRLFAGEELTSYAPHLVAMPSTVRDEAVALTPVARHMLKRRYATG